MQRLTDLPAGVESRVFRISEVAEHEAPQILAVLHDGGLVPDSRIVVVVRAGGQLRLVVEGHPVVLSEAVAAAVWVESGPASS
jgi:Fe2+ transport system protein FeoA